MVLSTDISNKHWAWLHTHSMHIIVHIGRPCAWIFRCIWHVSYMLMFFLGQWLQQEIADKALLVLSLRWLAIVCAFAGNVQYQEVIMCEWTQYTTCMHCWAACHSWLKCAQVTCYVRWQNTACRELCMIWLVDGLGLIDHTIPPGSWREDYMFLRGCSVYGTGF